MCWTLIQLLNYSSPKMEPLPFVYQATMAMAARLVESDAPFCLLNEDAKTPAIA